MTETMRAFHGDATLKAALLGTPDSLCIEVLRRGLVTACARPTRTSFAAAEEAAEKARADREAAGAAAMRDPGRVWRGGLSTERCTTGRSTSSYVSWRPAG